ncbi:MAG: membrane protein insertion efficiency factor YidD [Candidatus Levyibacteriota bacterium]
MKYFILKIIRFYQRVLSPALNSFLPLVSACRYSPVCSEYTYQAVAKYGAVKGLFLGTKRILSCNPLGGHGYRPLL